MKARNYIQQLMLLLIPVGLLTACTSDEEGGSLPNEGKVPVTVQLGGQYAIMSGKDAPESNTRATNNSALNGVKILNLSEGNTLWQHYANTRLCCKDRRWWCTITLSLFSI